MENLRVIGHRGVRGTGTENTLASFKIGLSSKADAIEFDVQLTKDKQPVVCHDRSSPRKIFGIERPVSEINLTDLKRYHSADGATIPTLEEVVKTKMAKPFILDIKSANGAMPVNRIVNKSAYKKQWIASSTYPEVLAELIKLNPSLQTTLHTYTNPFKAIAEAQTVGATGVTLVLYLLNPISYRQARRAGLKVLVYQNYAAFILNWRWFAKLLWILYPDIAIFTDRPDKIAS